MIQPRNGENWIAKKLRGLFWDSETDQQHRSCQHDVQPGNRGIIGDDPERVAIACRKSPNGNDRIDQSEDFETMFWIHRGQPSQRTGK